jgi:hypothetical protein
MSFAIPPELLTVVVYVALGFFVWTFLSKFFDR